MEATPDLPLDDWITALDESAGVDLFGDETGPDYDPDDEPDDDAE